MRLAGLGTVILLSSLIGCASHEGFRADITHRYKASQAWRAHAGECDPGEFPKDFTAGWKEGYLAVTSGSSGEVPPVPPEKYWKDRFRTPDGRVQIDAWFSGYQCGVVAADQDGSSQLAHIPVALGTYRPMAPIWQPGEWARPLPEQVPAEIEMYEEGAQTQSPQETVVESHPTEAASPVTLAKQPATVAEVRPQPAAPEIPRVAVRPIPSKTETADKPSSDDGIETKNLSAKDLPSQPAASVVPRLATRPVPRKAEIAEQPSSDAGDETRVLSASDLPPKPVSPAAPPLAARSVPFKAMIADKRLASGRDRTKDSSTKDLPPKPAVPATPRVAVRPVPSKPVLADKPVTDDGVETKKPSTTEMLPKPAMPAAPRVLVRFLPTEAKPVEHTSGDEGGRAKVSSLEEPMAQPAPPAIPRILVRIAPSDRLTSEQPVADDRDLAKAAAVEELMRQTTSPAIPRILVRIVPSQPMNVVQPFSDDRDRAKISSLEVPPRLMLRDGPEPQTFQTNQSTIKILMAARVDSPLRQKKPE